MPRARAHLGRAEQTECRVDGIGRRTIEPVEAARVSAPRQDLENRPCEIHPADFRLAMRPQPVTLVPQTDDETGTETAGTAGPLISRIARDAFGLEAVDGAIGIVSRDLVQAGIHDSTDTRDRQRRFRDVGREDHTALRNLGDCRVLSRRVERSVELDDLKRSLTSD